MSKVYFEKVEAEDLLRLEERDCLRPTPIGVAIQGQTMLDGEKAGEVMRRRRRRRRRRN